MNTIKIIVAVFILLLAEKVTAQYCTPPRAVSPLYEYISIDPPTLRWIPDGLTFYCNSYGVGFFDQALYNGCSPTLNFMYFLILGNDSIWNMNNYYWSNFQENHDYRWATRKFGGYVIYECAGILRRLPASLPCVTLIYPGYSVSNVDTLTTLDWTRIDSATNYRIRLYDHPSLENLLIDTISTVDSIRVKLLPNKFYAWHVKPYKIGGEGPFSDVYRFTTIIVPVPPAPILTSPPNGSTVNTTTPLLDWDNIPIANTYQVQISTDTALRTIVLDTNGLVNSSLTVPAGKLFPSALYYWRVRGNNSGGSGTWSLYWHFSVAPAPPEPVLLSPPNGSIGQSPTPFLDWDSIATANNYKVQVSKNTTFTNNTVDSSGLVYSMIHIPPGRLLPDSVYYWRVKGVNAVGEGPWSAIWYFRVSPVPPAPNLISPQNGSQGESITPLLEWDSIAIANNYQVQVSKNSSFTDIAVDSNNVINASMRVRSGVLQNDSLYYWRVRGNNISGQGSWSEIWNFRVLYVGISVISNEVPQKFELHNNFPNPFNPSTKIRFDIAKRGNVKIRIYDLLGKEINIPVNIVLEPGFYEITFDGTNYPSGVYFYKLETQAFTQTKRMVLIK